VQISDVLIGWCCD